CWPVFIAIALAPTLSRIWRDSDSGTMPFGAASKTSAPVCAAARRSVSHVMRKFAIEGTKISTSAIITKITVRTRSLPESPKRGARRRRTEPPAASAETNLMRSCLPNRQPPTKPTHQAEDAAEQRARQTRREVGQSCELPDLGKRWIG